MSLPNAQVAAMLASPGFYAVSGDQFKHTFSVVEVESGGTCHQLTPSPRFSRDGELSPDRWAAGVMVLGPFKVARAAEERVRQLWRKVA